MRILILTAGALALTAGMAQADPIVSPSAATEYSAHGSVEGYGAVTLPEPGAMIERSDMETGYVAPQARPADGFSYQNDNSARERTPNLGAGTSRSSSANNG